MKAIETTGKVDKAGILHLDTPLALKEQTVKVIVLIPDEADVEEREWLRAVSGNPAFDFLQDEKEDIYSSNDGKPFHD
jgi:hypothetical protein